MEAMDNGLEMLVNQVVNVFVQKQPHHQNQNHLQKIKLSQVEVINIGQLAIKPLWLKIQNVFHFAVLMLMVVGNLLTILLPVSQDHYSIEKLQHPKVVAMEVKVNG